MDLPGQVAVPADEGDAEPPVRGVHVVVLVEVEAREDGPLHLHLAPRVRGVLRGPSDGRALEPQGVLDLDVLPAAHGHEELEGGAGLAGRDEVGVVQEPARGPDGHPLRAGRDRVLEPPLGPVRRRRRLLEARHRSPAAQDGSLGGGGRERIRGGDRGSPGPGGAGTDVRPTAFAYGRGARISGTRAPRGDQRGGKGEAAQGVDGLPLRVRRWFRTMAGFARLRRPSAVLGLVAGSFPGPVSSARLAAGRPRTGSVLRPGSEPAPERGGV